MGHTTLAMTNHYASLTTDTVRISHEMYSPLRAKGGDSKLSNNDSGYWEEE
ncbi:MAG: hypothetical protein PVS3B3_12490 [Ktedonobacteraceae bacterium]